MSPSEPSNDTAPDLSTMEERLQKQLAALAGARVLCVGDVMLDKFVYGAVERISPEAPIPVLRVESETSMLGGAGNVTRNLLALGARVWLVSVVGKDEAGRAVTSLVGKQQAVEPHLIVETGRQTTIKVRYVAGGGHQLLRADRESIAPVNEQTSETISSLAGAAMDEAGILVLSDYGKGVLTPEVISSLIARAKQRGVPVVVDPKGRDYRLYRGADIVTPNRRELADATGMETADDAQVVAAARKVMADCEVGALLVTRSEQGMSLMTRDAVHHMPAEARQVFDVSGAGDTVAAVLSAALGGGLPVQDAARLANQAAGVVVGKIGTAVVHADELADTLRHSADFAGAGKVMTQERALDQVATWRRQKQHIGFTNGCFDLVHPGHVSLLAQARAACDRLIVGLNTDSSVRRLDKGPGRPINDEVSRAAVLAALGTVDLVVLFDEDTPIDLIRALRPNVLVKGADYRIDQVVGAADVQSYGGRVLLADVQQGHSTSEMVKRIGAK